MKQKFIELLNECKSENELQTFLEKNTQFFYVPFLLNHGVHFSALISKFQISTELISDFVFITKSSVKWRVVFCEIERPDKKLFVEMSGSIKKSAEFESGLSQIDSWKDYVKNHQSEIMDRLKPLLQPLSMRENPVEFKYFLVIGRTDELTQDSRRSKRFSTINSDTSDVEVVTYDSLLGYYQNLEYEKIFNILTFKNGKFHVKYLNRQDLGAMFSFMQPTELCLTKEQKELLNKNGHDIKSWESGKRLMLNGKQILQNWTCT